MSTTPYTNAANPERTIRDLWRENQRLRAALVAACELVQAERVAYYKGAHNRATGEIDDLVDRKLIARYDAVLRQADAALGVECERPAKERA